MQQRLPGKMSLSFSANQYDDAFRSNKLCNWEVPSQYKEHPRQMQGCTKIIANDRGHLQPGVPRSRNNPWGNFVGTWDIPQKIPGNTVCVSTARSTYAQEKLQREAEEANKVLSGNIKNANRTLMREGSGPPPRRTSAEPAAAKEPATSGQRSGAEAPGSKMFPDSYSPIPTPPHTAQTPVKAQSPTSPPPPPKDKTPSPIPGVPNLEEVLAKESREPTPKAETPHQGLYAL